MWSLLLYMSENQRIELKCSCWQDTHEFFTWFILRISQNSRFPSPLNIIIIWGISFIINLSVWTISNAIFVCVQDERRSPAVHVFPRAAGPEAAGLRHSDSAGGRRAEERADQDLQVTTAHIQHFITDTRTDPVTRHPPKTSSHRVESVLMRRIRLVHMFL